MYQVIDNQITVDCVGIINFPATIVVCEYHKIKVIFYFQKYHFYAIWLFFFLPLRWSYLTHWGRVTHICVGNLTIIGSDNGLSPFRRQAIIWTNAGILLIRTLGTNFSEILGAIHSFSFLKMHLKMSSAKWRLFGLGLNANLKFIASFVSFLKHWDTRCKWLKPGDEVFHRKTVWHIYPTW